MVYEALKENLRQEDGNESYRQVRDSLSNKSYIFGIGCQTITEKNENLDD